MQMPSKQGLNQGSKPNGSTGAQEFFAAGMRYPYEIPIHEALYDVEFHIYFRDTLIFDSLINNRQAQGEIIPYLTEAERVDVNPLLVQYERANAIRRYKGLPILVPQGEMPIFDRPGM